MFSLKTCLVISFHCFLYLRCDRIFYLFNASHSSPCDRIFYLFTTFHSSPPLPFFLIAALLTFDLFCKQNVNLIEIRYVPAENSNALCGLALSSSTSAFCNEYFMSQIVAAASVWIPEEKPRGGQYKPSQPIPLM
jgi:hypothetical protein